MLTTPFRALVKSEWSFTFDSSVCHHGTDKDFTYLHPAVCIGSSGSI
jgi:hypothetical protein